LFALSQAFVLPLPSRNRQKPVRASILKRSPMRRLYVKDVDVPFIHDF